MRARILKCSTCTRNNRSVSPPGLCIVYGAKKNSRKGWLFISIFFHTYRTIYCTSKVLRFLQELFRYGLREISMHHLFIPHRPHNDDVVGPADRPSEVSCWRRRQNFHPAHVFWEWNHHQGLRTMEKIP